MLEMLLSVPGFSDQWFWVLSRYIHISEEYYGSKGVHVLVVV
jgi:hypothetical protein